MPTALPPLAAVPLRARKYRDLKDNYLGAVGSPERDEFELELSLELLPFRIKELRRAQHLTQAELGSRLGIGKEQISRLERNAATVTLDTLIKVSAVLHTRLVIGFEPLAQAA